MSDDRELTPIKQNFDTDLAERVHELPVASINGFVMLFTWLAALIGGLLLLIFGIGPNANPAPFSPLMIIVGSVLMLAGVVALMGLFAVQPNDARVLILFGRYIGSERRSGFWWANPFASKKRISLRVRNFNSERVKVNDADGNPVEIAAVVVWRVSESAKAVFDVDDFEEFVGIQAETALRSLATRYPYDSGGEERASLRENPDELAAALKIELEDRLQVAGVDVLEARLTHLAYAPEIAQAMLRRQQAQAVVSARRLIVEAAVGMVEDALTGLSERGVVELDAEKRAAMANNLMVALTSEQSSTPIINTGTLYG
jgi:regulator of protease activity HflC (stomatin/prohibitin superfamily)